ncbi:hypothetical protein EWM64_g2671 [Hericium alpestre]|uniref:Ketoreductase domain-containing protein n=1 Tax=Hericium alpestre TaxID=135208 RepID=A0A4Z0A508_9AGAM|nr:hypothetical protein EWM64_g2671 [Hericium alpestre]
MSLSNRTVEADLPVTERFDVYPEIDPSKHFADKTYKGKVVLITGASRGIGKEFAIAYAKAGAALVLSARNQKLLDDVERDIHAIDPATKVVSVVADVADVKQVEAVVKAGVGRFGKLDVVIANAGMVLDWNEPIAEQDPNAWWSVFEVNLRGVHSLAHFTLPHLVKTDGYFVALSSGAAQFRAPNGSSYCISKHAVNRLIEFVNIEYPNVKAFAVAPGIVQTDMKVQAGFKPLHAIGLPVATMIYLTSGTADWLSGRYISAPWDLGEVRQLWKEKIEKEDALVSKLAIPA